MTEADRKTVVVDGLVTGYLEAGQGDPVVLLHGGEFGASAELGWERTIAALAAHTGCWHRTCWASGSRPR